MKSKLGSRQSDQLEVAIEAGRRSQGVVPITSRFVEGVKAYAVNCTVRARQQYAIEFLTNSGQELPFANGSPWALAVIHDRQPPPQILLKPPP
ncbi:hypothetical protein, partial [Pseudomonas fluorescens]|uniref:hypothetical protein n=1 Tax=Pseudomonas fluorescens TaxID=294 RepID=UPI001C37E544